jgi:amino acid transporter
MAKTLGAGWWSYLWATVSERMKRLVFGNPLATSMQLEHRLPIYLALPVFASDALSSVAYATEEILYQFEHAGIAALGLSYVLPISVAIVLLIIIVGLSYRQAVVLYPTGGGSYSVSKDNFGVYPSLVAAAALTIDYILTVAVSVSSGVEQLVSTWHAMLPYKIELALGLVLFLTLMNLRGTRESGWTFAAPVYLYVTLLAVTVITTLIRYLTGTAVPVHVLEPVAREGASTLGWLLILRAFASGCAALTGVESVANGMKAFEPPEEKNAAKTLLILVGLLTFLFAGVSAAAVLYHAVPTGTETIISQVARGSFGRTPLYFATVYATMLVLLIAANASFGGFPRLLALVAKDGYAPKPFITLGDRLVHNRGILVLATMSCFLIVYFKAKTNNLIPLYAVGVFICFTLAQFGMVAKIARLKEPNWRNRAAINFVGGVVTGLVALIQGVTKFTEGAWMVVVLLPILVGAFVLIHRHYAWFDQTMTVEPTDYNPLTEPAEPLTVVVLVSSDVHRGILEGLECGRALTAGKPDARLRAVHIEMDPEKTPRLKAKWALMVEPFLGDQIKLDIVPSPYRWLIEPIMDYLDWADLERSGDRVIVVLPEFVTGSWITTFLHNFTGRRLRQALLNRPHVTVVSSRYFMKPMAWRLGRGGLVY